MRLASEDDSTGGKFLIYCVVKSFPTDVVIFGCKRNPLNITGTNIVICRYNQRNTICIICSIQNDLSKHDTAIKYGFDVDECLLESSQRSKYIKIRLVIFDIMFLEY